jgi:hypothetical protein
MQLMETFERVYILGTTPQPGARGMRMPRGVPHHYECTWSRSAFELLGAAKIAEVVRSVPTPMYTPDGDELPVLWPERINGFRWPALCIMLERWHTPDGRLHGARGLTVYAGLVA